jgi:hypothetical protein
VRSTGISLAAVENVERGEKAWERSARWRAAARVVREIARFFIQ